MNYYNEFDPNAARWLRDLITAGLIPWGDEDTDQCIRAIGYCNMVRAALSERGDTPPVDGDKISCDGVVAITQHDNISEPMKGYFKAECNCSIFQGRTINEVAGRWAINRKCGKITIASALDSAAKEG